MIIKKTLVVVVVEALHLYHMRQKHHYASVICYVCSRCHKTVFSTHYGQRGIV